VTSRYFLPALPYEVDALEPWCDATTLELHHGTHHQAYVDGANHAAEQLDTIDPDDDFRTAGARAALDFNLGGHVMHSLFWENLSPDRVTPPEPLARRVAEEHGGLEALAERLVGACMGVQGSGWGVLYLDTVGDRIGAGSVHDHHLRLIPDARMLAVVDVWEHAYYLGHRNDRAGWVRSVTEHLDWDAVARRLDRAARLVGQSA
jgi:superoxide dismutase, Fe-Mn family